MLHFTLSESTAQNDDAKLRAAFYNLENLFHPENDSLTNDEEFTPEGQRYWSEYRYREKSARMAKAILSIGEWEPPQLVGVAEVENRQVLEDMIAGDVLRKFNYGILHYESPDRRGIDVGLLYRKDWFQPVYSHNFPVKWAADPNFKTRDVLYVKGNANELDTLHLLICHWPSRYGGRAQSEPKRKQAALTVKAICDSIRSKDENPLIIIMGDMNDEFHNASLSEHLQARTTKEPGTKNDLINLMALLPAGEGSHRYRGTWSFLDQIIVSGNLLDSEGVDISGLKANVHRPEFLLEKNEKYPGNQPFRSFIGLRYHGGFSDHLPVYIDLYRIPSASN